MYVDEVINSVNVEPREYQRRICRKAVEMYRGEYVSKTGLQPPSTSVMIESPTGSGKTCMAYIIAKALQVDDPDIVYGWIAMRRTLLKQAAKENVSKGFNVDNIHYVSMFDDEPLPLIEARNTGKRICLIIDEAQHDAASSMSHLHNLIKPDLILGMTATPFRSDRMKLCFNSIIKDCGIHQLIQDGYLAPYDHYSIPDWTPETISNHYCMDQERWGKSIFFFNSLEECAQLGALFADRGVRFEIVRGGQQKITEAQLEMFERDEVKCLINCMVLTEGFDCPSIQTVWVRDSSKGPTMQMGGRVFRQHPDLDYKQIVQSKHTGWPFIKTAMPLQQFVWVNDGWSTLKVNPKIDSVNEAARMAIAATETSMPKFILDRKDKKKPRRFIR